MCLTEKSNKHIISYCTLFIKKLNWDFIHKAIIKPTVLFIIFHGRLLYPVGMSKNCLQNFVFYQIFAWCLAHWGRMTHICFRKQNVIVQISACYLQLVSTKPLSEQMLQYCYFDPQEQRVHRIWNIFFHKLHVKISFRKWPSFFLDLDVANVCVLEIQIHSNKHDPMLVKWHLHHHTHFQEIVSFIYGWLFIAIHQLKWNNAKQLYYIIHWFLSPTRGMTTTMATIQCPETYYHFHIHAVLIASIRDIDLCDCWWPVAKM